MDDMNEITAELKHNPYLLQTEVRFNGESPRKNSKVRKFEGVPLRDWVDQIPKIFYQEMNGYDFDLKFTGTESGFQTLCSAFCNAGVSEKAVRLIHKNMYEDTDQKCAELVELLDWLHDHPNRRFDDTDFRDRHEELLAEKYPLIVIGGDVDGVPGENVEVETVHNAKELESTELGNTPIIFYVEDPFSPEFRIDLDRVLHKDHVKVSQMFFVFGSSVNPAQAERVLSDLGVDRPKIIARIDDEPVKQYLCDYPIADHIRSLLQAFNDEIDSITPVLEEANQKRPAANDKTQKEIDACDETLKKISQAVEAFEERDIYRIPGDMDNARRLLLGTVRIWQNRKTKAVGEELATEAAQDFEKTLRKNVRTYLNTLSRAAVDGKTAMEKEFNSIYQNADTDKDFSPALSMNLRPAEKTVSIRSALLDMRTTTFEAPKTERRGAFRKQADNEIIERVQVDTFYFDQWRNAAQEYIRPLADEYYNFYEQELKSYESALAEAYLLHLRELTEKHESEKANLAGGLSDAERRLQEDNDWLKEFQKQVRQIERG